MKTKLIPPMIIALAASAIPATLCAQAVIPGFESSVTIQLIIYSTEPGLYARDDTGQVIQPKESVFYNEWTKESNNGDTVQFYTDYGSYLGISRISNREILELLVDQGVITSTSGWSLKVVEAADGSAPYFYITKSGSDPIYVGDFISLEEIAAAEAVRIQSVTKTRSTSSGDVTTYSESGYSTLKALYSVNIVFPETEDVLPLNFALTGLGCFTTKVREVDDDIFLEVPQGGRMELMGTADTLGTTDGVITVKQGALESAEIGVAEGCLKVSSAKVLDDISDLYPEVTPTDLIETGDETAG